MEVFIEVLRYYMYKNWKMRGRFVKEILRVGLLILRVLGGGYKRIL